MSSFEVISRDGDVNAKERKSINPTSRTKCSKERVRSKTNWSN